MKQEQQRKKPIDSMLITLCASCAQQFYDSGGHIIRRSNHAQQIKDTCCYCGRRRGWDYTVEQKKGGAKK